MRFPRARGRTVRRQAGEMNRTEAQYRELLAGLPETFSVDFERVTLKLANDTRYTPDFMVLKRDGSVEFHEVKGFMEDDAFVKLKVAADQFPMFSFVLAKRKPKKQGGGWEIKPVGNTQNGEGQ